MSFEQVTWANFCVWLQGRLVSIDRAIDENIQELIFTDGYAARLRSLKSSPTRGYSEQTPGSDGHLLVPEVSVSTERVYSDEDLRLIRAAQNFSL